jgi:hypothetical protein
MPDFFALPENEIMQIISHCRNLDEKGIIEHYPEFSEEILSLITGILSIENPSFALVENPLNQTLQRKDWSYWNSYCSLLLGKGRNWNRITQIIDATTERILSFTSNPRGGEYTQSRGLVIGHIQSGKTANFTGLVSKSADMGYNLIIILAGTNNALRNQTQIRLDNDLFDEHPIIPRKPWIKLTSEDLGPNNCCDFGGSPLGIDNLPYNGDPSQIFDQEIPVVAVVKKREHRMRLLCNWIVGNEEEEIEGLPEEIRQNLNILILDDEADSASINTIDDNNRVIVDEDGTLIGFRESTAINECIRKILHFCPRSSYIGYTATPYANVLIDGLSYSEELGHTLYPRDFILTLPRPHDPSDDPIHYDGIDTFFGINGGLNDSVSIIPLGETNLMQNPPPTEQNDLTLPPLFEGALRDFFITGAIKSISGMGNDHHTMLIHNSINGDDHENVRQKTLVVVRHWKNLFNTRRMRRYSEVYLEFRRYFEENYQGNRFSWDEVSAPLGDFFRRFVPENQIRRINSRTDDLNQHVIPINAQLDYANHSESGLKVIAIGGTILSRGLTVEGLTVSYFTRETAIYDSLAQMARWCGFHKGFRDLVRVYTSEMIFDWFRWLDRVDHDLREDIARYDQYDASPLTLAPRILRHVRDFPGQRVMNPTRAGAMTSTQTHFRGFNGSVLETRLFPVNQPTVINRNMELTGNFLESLFCNFKFEHNNSYVWKQNIPVQEIITFLQNYQADENEGRFNIADILRYIRRRIGNGEALLWSVILAGKTTPGEQLFPNVDQPINKFGRGSVGNGRIDQLTDDTHLCLDLDNIPPEANLRRATIDHRNPNSPLLIVYVIDKDYQPPNTNTDRGRNYVSLFNGLQYSLDTVGLGIVFPDSPSILENETNQYYSTRGIPIE